MAIESIPDKLDRIARSGFPTIASIEVTARCNARCGYCYVKDSSFGELSTDQLCMAIEKLSQGGVFHLHITGGEPFLRPDILTILSFAFDHGVLFCTLFSNGILLNDDHRNFLVQNRDLFHNIQMSVFSHVPAINDRFFGIPGALDTIMRNALFLKKNGLRVSLAMNVLDFNIAELEKTRKFFEKHDLPLLLSYFKMATSSQIENFIADSTTISFFKQYLYSLRPEELDKFKLAMKKSLEIPVQSNADLCLGRWNNVFMNVQGDLSPCITFRNIKFGNIFEERSVHDILKNAADYNSICALKKKDMKKCTACKFFNYCTICLGVIHTQGKSFCSPDYQMCNFAHALYEIIVNESKE